MRPFLIGAGMLVVTLAVLAEPSPEKIPAAEVPVLPLSIPGYELRVLDVKKPVVFNVAGLPVEGAPADLRLHPCPQPGPGGRPGAPGP